MVKVDEKEKRKAIKRKGELAQITALANLLRQKGGKRPASKQYVCRELSKGSAMAVEIEVAAQAFEEDKILRKKAMLDIATQALAAQQLS